MRMTDFAKAQLLAVFHQVHPFPLAYAYVIPNGIYFFDPRARANRPTKSPLSIHIHDPLWRVWRALEAHFHPLALRPPHEPHGAVIGDEGIFRLVGRILHRFVKRDKAVAAYL